MKGKYNRIVFCSTSQVLGLEELLLGSGPPARVLNKEACHKNRLLKHFNTNNPPCG